MKDTKTFSYQIGERAYHLTCDSNSPVTELKDALCHFITNIVNYEKAALAEIQAKQLEQGKDNGQSV